MRFAFLLSGAGGFFLVVAVGLGSGRDIEIVLRDAAIASVLCGFVGRWFWLGLESAFARTLAARQAEAEAAASAATETPPSPSPVPSSAGAPRAAVAPAKPAASAKAPAPALAGAARR